MVEPIVGYTGDKGYPPDAKPSSTRFIEGISPPSNEPLPQPPEYTDSDAENLFDGPWTPSEDVQFLVHPQFLDGYYTPFLRACSPDLELWGIEQEDWLKFLDGH